MKKLILFIVVFGLPIFAHATWNEFYMVTTGSNTNSGSTSSNTPTILSSSGSWGASGTLNRYISTFSAFGTASVGQMASIYIATTTGGAVFIASITAVVSATTIDLDTTTIKYGVAPSTAANNGYAAAIGGAWSSLAVLTSIFNSRVVPQSTRINIQAGTYANTTNTRTFGSSGGNRNLLWWRGYKTTPGDQDTNNLSVVGTDIPNWTWTTGAASLTGASQIFSNLSFSGFPTSGGTGTIDNHAVNQSFYRCRIVNSSNVANGMAFVQNSAALNTLIQSSYIQASTVATSALSCSAVAACFIVGSVVNGGNVGVSLSLGGSTLYDNIIYGSNSNAINAGTTGGLIIIGNSIYAPKGDGIHFTAAAAAGTLVFNNYIESANQSNTAAINSLTSTNTVHISGNAYNNCTLNISTTILEGFTIYDNTTSLTQAAFVNPSIQNFSILPVAQGIGYPSLFENLPNDYPQSYLDAGAKQHKGIPGGGFAIAN